MSLNPEYSSLQDWMERTGTNQKRLAELAGMQQSQLSEVLKGSRRCSLLKALALHAVTGVPVEKMTAWPKPPVGRTRRRVSKSETGFAA
jgi:transcriptional regulator with XRE-family HTH domain